MHSGRLSSGSSGGGGGVKPLVTLAHQSHSQQHLQHQGIWEPAAAWAAHQHTLACSSHCSSSSSVSQSAVLTPTPPPPPAGALYTRNAYAEVSAAINPVMPGGEHRTKDTEGVCLRIKGDGKGYACVLTTEDGSRWGAEQVARRAWSGQQSRMAACCVLLHSQAAAEASTAALEDAAPLSPGPSAPALCCLDAVP